MATYKTVAVTGATGNLGPSLVQGLVDAGFEVTILTRSGKVDNLSVPVKRIVKVDYTSHESMVSALRGHDAVVSNSPDHAGQTSLIDAAIAAGVRRFIPSEFGVDAYRDAKTAEIPYWRDGKVVVQRYLREKGDAIDWTLVVTGLFFDWGLKLGWHADLKGTTRLYDNGDKKIPTTLLSDIGKAVAGVLQHPEETKNRAVYVLSAYLSQNDILAIAQKVNPSFKAETVPVDLTELEKESYAIIEKGGDEGTAIANFIVINVFGHQYKSAWNEENDNELLGVKRLTEGEIEDVVKSCM